MSSSSTTTPSLVSSSPVPDPLAEIAHLRGQLQHLYQLTQQNAAASASSVAASSVVGSSSSLPKIRQPVSFKGEMGYFVDDWISEMEQQFAYYQNRFPDDKSRIMFAVAYFTGPAIQWWNHEPNKNSLLNGTWLNFIACIRSRFRPVQPTHLARQRLDRLVQRNGSSVNQYANLFQSILNPITDMSDADQVHRFIKGLLPQLASKVFEKNPADLKAAINWAVHYEATGIYGKSVSVPTFGSRNNYNGSSSNSNSSSASSDAMDINNVLVDDNESESMMPQFHEEIEEKYPTTNSNATNTNSGGNYSRIVHHGSNKLNNVNMNDPIKLLLNKLEAMENRISAISNNNNNKYNNNNSHNYNNGNRRSGNLVPGLKAGDIARLRAEGRCFRCKQTGHMKNQCTNPARLN